MIRLQPRERRFVLGGMVVVAVVLGYTFAGDLLERQDQRRTRIAAGEERLAQRQRLVARRELYRRQLQALEAEITQRRVRLLPGDKPPLAASELQKLVKTTAQETGVEVRSERVLPTAERGGYAEVPVEVTLWGPIRPIVAFLHRLEGTPVLLGVSDLKLRVASVGTPRELTATLALSGYIATAGGPEGDTRPGRTEPARKPGS